MRRLALGLAAAMTAATVAVTGCGSSGPAHRDCATTTVHQDHKVCVSRHKVPSGNGGFVWVPFYYPYFVNPAPVAPAGGYVRPAAPSVPEEEPAPAPEPMPEEPAMPVEGEE